MSDTPYLSVIIPAYNEEKRITQTLQSIHDYLTDKPFTWEMLVVIDGATDDTLGCVERFATAREADADHIRWLDRAQNRGKGYTVREGMLEARGQVRLFTDADNSTEMSHFDPMQPLLQEGHEVVIGSRDHKDVAGARQAVPQPFLKRALGNAGNLLIQVLAVPGIWDTQCGFKAFTAAAAERIFSVARINGWGFDIEALALARRYGYQVAIIPTYWVDAAGTHVKTSDYFKTLGEALKVRWNLLSGVYQTQNRIAQQRERQAKSKQSA